MAGWSALSNGSAEIGRSNGHCLVAHRMVDDSDDQKCKARCLFDQLLSAFHGGVLPVPAMLGDGGSADLFELFWAVRKRGGYDLVSRKGSWDLVAEDLGVDPGVTASVKLVYSKYLNELDQWLKGNGNGNGNGDDFQHAGNFRLLELKTKFRGMLLDVAYDDSYAELVSIDGDLDIKVCEFKLKNNKILHDKGKFDDDDDEKSSDTVRLDRSSLKRKRESLSGMLNWVIQAAKHSDNPAFGEIPGPSKWKNHGSNELWMQVIRARESQLHKRPVGSSNEQSLLQKKYKMHPSMYEDDTCLSHQPTARVRCRERLSTSFSQVESTQKKDPENAPKKQTSGTIDTPGGDSENDLDEKHVSVGPRFQAVVPEWTGEVLESDTKWLGTRVWPLPPENAQQRLTVEADTIGRGRSDTCECRFPGCVECVRFHIAEKRMKLKQELQSVFYRWRFERMGEEISLRWTIEEEKRFKEMVTLNPPSLGKCFWDYAFKYFPTKLRSDLLSYYFNVFLVQRRSYQNRVTPRDIDSDDDESEFGSIGERFGHGAVTVGGSNLPVCTENKQCKHME